MVVAWSLCYHRGGRNESCRSLQAMVHAHGAVVWLSVVSCMAKERSPMNRLRVCARVQPLYVVAGVVGLLWMVVPILVQAE